jgi:predicted nucleotidyltransferase
MSRAVETSQSRPVTDWATLRPEVTEELLQGITQRIVEAFHPHKIILFGSYAYGTPHKDSDVDLFVIMDSDDTMHDRIVKVYPIAKVPFLPMDVIVRTPEEVETRVAMGDFFVIEILEKGRILYARDAA